MTDFAGLIIDSQAKSIRINQIKVEGLVHTKHEFIQAITEPLIEANTLGDVIIGTRNVATQLRGLGIFKEVSITLDANPNTEPDCVDVVYTVVERPRIDARTGADFGYNEGSMNMSLLFRNAFGKAETIMATSSYGVDTTTSLQTPKDESVSSTGMQGASAHQLTFTKPLFTSSDQMLEANLFKNDRNHTALMSYQEAVQGFTASIKNTISANSLYEVAYNAIWRENHSLSPNASLTIRKDAGHSLKSSISHSFSIDTRDDTVFPTVGRYLRIFQELAGFGGNVSFLKNELNSLYVQNFTNFISISGSMRCGVLFPLSFDGSNSGVRVNDRFQLGGPNSLRGFSQSGVGPRESKDSIGGDLYYGVGLSALFPLPVLPSNLFRGHTFVNGGSLVRMDKSNIMESTTNLFANPSVAAGVGLVARFTNFRLELNYCVPLRATTTDLPKHGFQFGIGMHFM
ncbi:hypothetical protein HDV04_002990 [Boothiomyces sp. JEL0838]|nr:hypothetical protein HDV04_002990 [Boothiomyces sp. JEL0838]